MNPHRAIMSRLCLCAILAALVAGVYATGWSATPSDWSSRLLQATNVSHEGYADSTFLQRAQDSAISIAQVILSEVVSESPSDSAARASILAALGDFSFRKRDYRAAVGYWEDAIRIGGANDSNSSLRLCLPVIAGHRDALSPELAREMEDRYTRLLLECPPDSLRQLWMLAHLCENMWMYGEARLLHERVVATHASHTEADGHWAIYSLVTLGEMTSKRIGIPHVSNQATLQDSAVLLAERALSLARSLYGTTDTMFAYVADRLGDYYARQGRRAAAIALWDSSWTANKLHLQPEHIEFQGNLDRMSSVYRAQGRFADALALGLQALELRKKVRGEGHPEVASMYGNLGRTYQATGRFQQAEACFLAALEIRERAIERSLPLIAESYRQLGWLYYDDGRYALADAHFRRAIDLMRGALGTNHSWVASCMRDLAAMYNTWGRPAEAHELLKQALTIQEQFLGREHPSLASTLEAMAQTELMLGQQREAEQSISKALAVEHASLANDGVPLPTIHTAQAKVLLASGKLADAERVIAAVVNAHDSALMTSQPQIVDELILWARTLIAQHKMSDAQACFDRVFRIDSVYGGLDVTAMADARDEYTRLLLRQGRSSDALAAAKAALLQRLRFLEDGGRVLSEHRALSFQAAMHQTRDLLLSAYFDAAQAGGANPAEVADFVLASKGAISDRIFEREHRARLSESGEVRTLRDSLQFARARLAGIYIKGPSDMSASVFHSLLDSARRSKDEVESRLARVLGTDSSTGFLVEMDDVRNALPDASCLLEYVRYRNAAQPTTESYAAMMIPKTGPVEMTDLGESQSIDSLVAAYQAHMSGLSERGMPPDNADRVAYQLIARSLSARIWDPLEGRFAPGSLVLVAPDAQLSVVAFAGLVDRQGAYLIESHPIHYVTCGRALADPPSPTTAVGALIVCDPDYDADAAARKPVYPIQGIAATATGSSGTFSSLRSSCETFAKREFNRLPGTRKEAEVVGATLAGQFSAPFELLDGASASEENFKRLCSGRRLLHLATHGFYLSEECVSKTDADRLGFGSTLIGENPLLLSGLCLAGANLTNDRQNTLGDDGVLTAEEVSSLSLDGTKWVVLSACDSRRGQPKSGEGLFGLQRAFQMAGAQSVISALWQVSDGATISFMQILYENCNRPLHEGIRRSQLDAISEMRRRGRPDHPYNWGAFVATGRWNSLN